MHNSAIAVHQVTKMLDKVRRFDTLTFDCEPGQVYGLLGPNGAGKTTRMNLVTGPYRPTCSAGALPGTRAEPGE